MPDIEVPWWHYLACSAAIYFCARVLRYKIRTRLAQEHYAKYGTDNIDNALQRFDS